MSLDVYVVRQPIFDDRQQVIAYELLFHRPSGGDARSDLEMTSQVIVNSMMHIGLDVLAGDTLAYVNMSRDLLMDDTVLLLPPDRIGLEVLESVEVDEALLEALKRLKGKGYRIVLDDFEYEEHKRPLVELADGIKVDVLHNPDIRSTLEGLRPFSGKLVAEKVETHAQYAQMRDLGFSQFQGYFFCKPQPVAGKRLPDAKLAVIRALKEVSAAESIDQMFDVIGRDLNLSYRLLRYINSVGFGVRLKIDSVEQALAMLGLENTQRWLLMLSMVMLGEDKPPQLVRQAMLRGKLLEDIARMRGVKRLSDYFMLGMFSLLEALLDQPVTVAVEEIALPEVVRQGLFESKSVPALMLLFLDDIEHADWLAMRVGSQTLDVDLDAVMQAQIEAVAWLDQHLAMLSEAEA